jgi:hypothetical protein
MTTPSLLQSVVAIGAALAANAARRAAATLAGLLLSVAMLAASLVFLTMAAYLALSHSIGEVYALLIVGSAYFVASLITLLIVQVKRR